MTAPSWPLKTFADGNVLPASDLNGITGTLNNLYSTGTWPGQLSYNDGTIPRYIPFATQIDSYNPSASIAANASVSITFSYNTSRFTNTPICFPTVLNQAGTSTVALIANVVSVASGTVTVRVYNAGTTTVTAANWYAYCLMIQVTPSASVA